MSEIKVDTVLKDPNGSNVIGTEGKPFTLAKACVMALDAALPIDANEGFKPKMRRGKLIEEITAAEKSGKLVKIDASDAVLLKERIGGTFTSASLVRSLCLLIDPATKEE